MVFALEIYKHYPCGVPSKKSINHPIKCVLFIKVKGMPTLRRNSI